MSAPAEAIRATIVDALEDAGAAEGAVVPRLAAFESGQADVPLSDLALDSVVRMELLVALEMEHEAVLGPEVFGEVAGLAELAERAAASSDAAGCEQENAPVEAAATAAPAVPLPRAARLFRRAFDPASTVVHARQLLERIGERITPTEFEELHGAHRAGALVPPGAPPKFGTAVDTWFATLERWMAGAGKERPEPYVATRLAPAAVHYSADPAPSRSERVLVVCFTTMSQRTLWMPQPVLLQHFDAGRVDVLVMSDPLKSAFRGRVPGVGRNVNDVVDWLARHPLVASYAEVRTMGASAGAYPAVLAGRALRARRSLGVAGRFPAERHVVTLAVMYFRSIRAALRTRGLDVVLAYNARKRRDRAYAHRLAFLTGARPLAVPPVGGHTEHDFLGPMVEHGELGAFLDEALF
ncbi:MAG: hypothetical protein AAFP22_12875 [Planctomycetota bacterium]